MMLSSAGLAMSYTSSYDLYRQYPERNSYKQGLWPGRICDSVSVILSIKYVHEVQCVEVLTLLLR